MKHGLPLRLTLSLSLVFLSGILVGAFSHRLYTVRSVDAKSMSPSTPEQFRQQYVQEMRSRLKLDAQQLERLNGILDETRARYKAVKERYRPEMKQIQEQQTERVREMLKQDQRQEYERLREERERRRKAADRPSPGC